MLDVGEPGLKKASLDPECQHPGEEGDPPATELIEKLGFGWSQVKSSFVGGGIWLSDGAELLLISSVSQAVGKEWDLTPFLRGFVVSIVFFGILVGNVCSGPIGDNFGRRQLLVFSFLGIFVFSVLSSLAWSYAVLCAFRFCVGIAVGAGQPAWSTLGAEITPSWLRAIMMCVSLSFFTLGEMFSATMVIVDDPSMENLHWRSLLLLGAVPSLIFFCLSLVFLRESPIYLAHAGRTQEAREVLEAMRYDNGAHDVSIRFSVKRAKTEDFNFWVDTQKQLGLVFGKRMFHTTTVVMFSCFVLNLNYYGCLYAFPQLLPDLVAKGSAATELLIGALWELPGNLIGAAFGVLMARKRAMKIYLALTFAALVAFPIGAGSGEKTWVFEALMYFGYYGIKCFVAIGFVIVYQYAVEVYPTEVRITGSALNLGAGRIAATLASVVYELIVSTSSFAVFFFGAAVLTLVNFALIDSLRYETMGAALQDSVADPEMAPFDAPASPGPYGAAGSASYAPSKLVETI